MTTNTDPTNPISSQADPAMPSQGKPLPSDKARKPHFGGPKGRKRTMLGAGAAALLAVGVLLGGAGTALLGNGSEASLVLKPKTIASLADSSSTVAIAGTVSEIFGNKLIVEDGSGRALVETGPARWSSGAPAEKGEAVTVQGRFEDGFLHAKLLVHADGTVEDLGPAKPPFKHMKDEIARLAGQ